MIVQVTKNLSLKMFASNVLLDFRPTLDIKHFANVKYLTFVEGYYLNILAAFDKKPIL